MTKLSINKHLVSLNVIYSCVIIEKKPSIIKVLNSRRVSPCYHYWYGVANIVPFFRAATRMSLVKSAEIPVSFRQNFDAWRTTERKRIHRETWSAARSALHANICPLNIKATCSNIKSRNSRDKLGTRCPPFPSPLRSFSREGIRWWRDGWNGWKMDTKLTSMRESPISD